MTNPTMLDVAAEAGVSSATVSRVFTNPDSVSAETRHRVEEAVIITKYKYPVKNKHDKSTISIQISKKTLPIIGVAIHSCNSNAFADQLLGIQDASQKMGFALTIGRTNYNKHHERSLLEKFQEDGVAGMILGGFFLSNDTLVRQIVHSGVPACVICEYVNDTDISYVGFDNFKAIYDLANYLIKLGHYRIGLICGPFSKNDRSYRRLNGYRSALEEHSITYDSELVYEAIPSMEEGRIGVRQLMSIQNPPSAILAGGDVFALGVLAEIPDMGLKIPDDLSVVSIDNVSYAEYTVPPLTTIKYNAYEIGFQSVQAIAQNIYSKKPNIVHKCFDTAIVFRKSAKEYTPVQNGR